MKGKKLKKIERINHELACLQKQRASLQKAGQSVLSANNALNLDYRQILKKTEGFQKKNAEMTMAEKTVLQTKKALEREQQDLNSRKDSIDKQTKWLVAQEEKYQKEEKLFSNEWGEYEKEQALFRKNKKEIFTGILDLKKFMEQQGLEKDLFQDLEELSQKPVSYILSPSDKGLLFAAMEQISEYMKQEQKKIISSDETKVQRRILPRKLSVSISFSKKNRKIWNDIMAGGHLLDKKARSYYGLGQKERHFYRLSVSLNTKKEKLNQKKAFLQDKRKQLTQLQNSFHQQEKEFREKENTFLNQESDFIQFMSVLKEKLRPLHDQKKELDYKRNSLTGKLKVHNKKLRQIDHKILALKSNLERLNP